MDKPEFSLKTSLKYILANQDVENKNEKLPIKERNKRNTFDKLMFDIHKYFPLTDKIGRGVNFEYFCVAWLQANRKYKNIWLWKDLSDDFKKKMGIKKKKNKEDQKKRDIGIDIITEDYKGRYSAIQCKYLNPVTGRPVNYGKLSTFLALCKQSLIPFKKEILMTNVYQYGGKFGNDVTMSKNQRVINSTIFRKTPREIWERIAGYTEGYILGTASGSIPSGKINTENKEEKEGKINKEENDKINYNFPGKGNRLDESSDDEKPNKTKEKKPRAPRKKKMPGKGVKLSNIKDKPKSLDELREERLTYLEKNNNESLPKRDN